MDQLTDDEVDAMLSQNLIPSAPAKNRKTEDWHLITRQEKTAGIENGKLFVLLELDG